MFEFGQKLVKKLVEILKRPSPIRRRGFKGPSFRRNLVQQPSSISAEKMAESLRFSREEADALFSSPAFSFPQSKHAALEEIQAMLGLMDEELTTVFSLLEKADDGYLGFHLGLINIEFQTPLYGGRLEDEITVRVEMHEKETTQIVEYRFPRSSDKAVASKKKP